MSEQPAPAIERLTKRFYMSLPEGAYVVSCVGESPGKPCFAGYVVAPAERAQQWGRIRNALADQRNCYVFRSKREHEAHVADWCRSS